MGRISDSLIEVTGRVLEELNIGDDDINFDAVQNWIIENVNMNDLPSTSTIAVAFRENNICPQCQTIVDGRHSHHTCLARERL